MLTIMGATGKTGRVVAERLLGLGEEVRVLGRSADRLRPLAALGAEAIAGDAGDPAYLTKAFRGAAAAYTMLPDDFQTLDHNSQQARIGEATVTAIRESQIKHIVFISSIGGELPAGTGFAESLHAQEERLKSVVGLNVLILRAAFFFENHFGTLDLIKGKGINGGAFASDLAIPMIASEDIAERAAKALRQRAFEGTVVQELLGERDLSMNAITRIIGERIGKRDLQYVRFSYEDLTQALVGTGWSQSISVQFVEMVRAVNDGTIKSVEGRRPESTTPTRFEDFAEKLAAAYRAA